jgi:hypothetical protein
MVSEPKFRASIARRNSCFDPKFSFRSAVVISGHLRLRRWPVSLSVVAPFSYPDLSRRSHLAGLGPGSVAVALELLRSAAAGALCSSLLIAHAWLAPARALPPTAPTGFPLLDSRIGRIQLRLVSLPRAGSWVRACVLPVPVFDQIFEI